jgi:hypothetical protein
VTVAAVRRQDFASKGDLREYWLAVLAVVTQLQGLVEGYGRSECAPHHPIDVMDMWAVRSLLGLRCLGKAKHVVCHDARCVNDEPKPPQPFASFSL